MIKKPLAVILAATMAALVVGCGVESAPTAFSHIDQVSAAKGQSQQLTGDIRAIVAGNLAVTDCIPKPECLRFLNANLGKRITFNFRVGGADPSSLVGTGSVMTPQGLPWRNGPCELTLTGSTDGTAISVSGFVVECRSFDNHLIESGDYPVAVLANAATREIKVTLGPLIGPSFFVPGFVFAGTGAVTVH